MTPVAVENQLPRAVDLEILPTFGTISFFTSFDPESSPK